MYIYVCVYVYIYIYLIAIYSKEMTIRRGQPEEKSQNWTVRTGQANMKGRKRQADEDKQ
jgi:hypothetical protein